MIRADHELIAQGVARDSRVLDLGCGDGQLLAHLQRARRVRGYGIEIVPERVVAALNNGIQVLQVNLEEGLSGFAGHSFDTVILSQTLQAMRHTEALLAEMLRVGREGIVTFPNFGYWRHRWQVLWGKMPKSSDMPYEWYDTPNVHLCTLEDFEALCQRMGVQVMERRVMGPHGNSVALWPNFLGSLAYYRIRLSQ